MGVGINLGQVNFSKGVLAPDLHARVDVTSYNAGLKRGENIVLLKRGGFQNRQGTFYVHELPGPGRLFPFQYSIDQTYALALTQGKMEPFAFGGAVLEQDTKITAITNANPAVVTMPFHGLGDGDELYFSGISGMTELNDRILGVTVIDGDTFSIAVDATAWGEFTESTGTLNEAPPPPPPPPPPVPPPPPPPPPPNTGGGGGTLCVTDDSLILLADGSEIVAAALRPNMVVWGRHEETWKGGGFPVTAVSFALESTMALHGYPDATPNHRFGRDSWWARLLPSRWRWWRMRQRGFAIGPRRVAKISVDGARTYYARHPEPGSPWRLCHNIKDTSPGEI